MNRIHDMPCDHCPSAHFPSDPECLDILNFAHTERVKLAFPCAWRPEKLCKGNCDFMGVSEHDIRRLCGEAQGD